KITRARLAGAKRPTATLPKLPVACGARDADMTKPSGCLRRLTAKMMRLARNGNVEGLRTYVASDAFLVDFTGLDHGRRQSAMRCHATAEALCEGKARQPLAPPGAIDAKRAQKASWSDLAMRTRLADAYVQAGGDHEKAARILGVSLGSARLARMRYL